MSVPALLVLGATGMLGRAAVQRLRARRPEWRIEATTRGPGATYAFAAEEGEAALTRILRESRCTDVLNAIGVLASEIVNSNPLSVAQAVTVNAWFPHVLAAAASTCGCRVWHVSTDAVFSGRSDRDYEEGAPVDPSGVYAMSKSLGESNATHVLNIRCSIVGRDPRGKGLLEWLLRMRPGEEVCGFTDYVWTPATVPQLIDFIEDVIASDGFGLIRERGPVLHYAPNPPLSKFEFLRLVDEVAGRSQPVVAGHSPSGPCRRVLATRHTYLRASNWIEPLRELFTDLTGVHEA